MSGTPHEWPRARCEIPWAHATTTTETGEGHGSTPDLAQILDDVRVFMFRYVVLSQEQATLLAPWIAMTHAIDAFDFCAYVHVTSPLPECGKSRLLEVAEALVKNPGRPSA